MKSFKEFIAEEITLEEKFIGLVMAAEHLDSINESENDLDEAIKDVFNKTGLKIHKSKGILDYVKSFGTSVGKVFLYLFKGENEKAKAIVKSLKKEDVLDFLLKLDLGTLHLVTGPIHTIDAWTGWELGVNLNNKVKSSEEKLSVLQKTIENAKKLVKDLFSGKKLSNMMHSVNIVQQKLQKI